MGKFWDLFKKPAADAAATVIGSVTAAIDEIVTNKEERTRLKMEAEKQLQDYTVKMEELSQASEKMFIEDTQNARAMQIEALRQGDTFSKRFVYYLAIGLAGAAIVYDFCLFFVTYPEANRDMINFVCGIINTGAFMSVVNFFLGSSKGSSEKNDIITNLSTPK
jgi:hypothetical protein